MSNYTDAELRKRNIQSDENANPLVEADSGSCNLLPVPEDEHILDSKNSSILGNEQKKSVPAPNATRQDENVVTHHGWDLCYFHHLPTWLQDNDFLLYGHRPPLPSFRACLNSIFRIHTETVNIWTHFLGCIAFIGIALYFLASISADIELEEKIAIGAFFAGLIICLAFSFTCHTFHCHSHLVMKFVAKLDYCGIALLIMGSFVPWLYYGFYCHFLPKVLYLTMVCTLGTGSITVGFFDKFSEPSWRTFRACVFVVFGLSAVFPAFHYILIEGWYDKLSQKPFALLVLMGFLYILGAIFYAMRMPERWFPGKYDIWFHSHQIFHVCVLAAAYVHYHNISEMAMHRVDVGQCV